MGPLLALSRLIDRITAGIGKAVMWLILVAVLVSAGNAIIRKVFNSSSNAWLELQWYLFGAAFMGAAAYTLQQNEHIRIDIFYGTRTRRTQHWIDLFGHVFFTLPFVTLMSYLLIPYTYQAWSIGQISTNAGGLIIWPARAVLAIGFILLIMQAISEIIKKIAVMQGLIEDPHPFVSAHEAAELEGAELAAEVTRLAEESKNAGGDSQMIEFIAVSMAPIMFASLVIFLLLGYPVAFSLAANGIVFFAIGVWLAPYSEGTITLDWALIGTMPQRLWGTMSNDTLLAIPFFTFMGIILERSGMAEDLLDTVGQLFGPIRGGLAYAVIFVGALLAATTGVVAASVIAMGLISLPIMLRYGYDRRVASGVIAASGTLAQIIPPSLVLIVLADQLGRSVGDMYTGAIIPGLVLTSLYVGYVFLVSIFRPTWVPALPPEARTLGHGITSLLVAIAVCIGTGYVAHIWLYESQGANADILGGTLGVLIIYVYAMVDKTMKINTMSRLAQQVIIVLIPPLALIFLVLGTIFLGIATPTEGGAMGALGAMLLAAMKGRFNYTVVSQALAATTRLSAFVMFILVGARMFSLAFYGVNGQIWVEHLLVGLPGGQTGFLIIVSILVFLLAFFLDFFELAFIIVPLLVAPAEALGIDLIWFGIILAVNMQTSFMHPPFGFALFYLRSVAPKAPYTDKITGERQQGVSTGQIYWGAVPFVIIQVIMIGVVIAFPQMVMHYKGPVVDPTSIEIKVPTLTPLGGADAGGGTVGGLPKLGAPVVNP